jgi:hypothetical protein
MTISWRNILPAAILLCATAGSGQTGVHRAGAAPSRERESVSGGKNVLPRAAANPSRAMAGRIGRFAVSPAAGPSVTLLGSTPTASPAESFALNGNLAYVCDDNEISVIDVTNPSNPHIVATAVSSLIHNSGNIHCAVQRNTLSVFADQANSLIGNSPGFIAFSLTNPTQPQLIQATPLNKRFFQDPVYIGNFAFVPTFGFTFSGPTWDNQRGDLLAVDLTNFSSPTLLGTLEQPQIDPILGGATIVEGGTQADSALIYLGGSTSTGGPGTSFGTGNNGVGRLQVADVSNPAGMKLAGQLLIPGTIHFSAPLIQGTVGVGIGNTGGFRGSFGANPLDQGNIVVATFDVSDRRAPAALSITTTNYQVGAGGGATRIGNLLFAFAGVLDANNNQVLLVVDATNPLVPMLQSIPIPQPFTSMQAVGTTLYATLGSSGFATYAIPGIGTGVLQVCPASIDAMLVVDRGANIPGQAFLDAEAALKAFINSLHLPLDQVGVASFTSSAVVNQTLTTNAATAMSAFNGIIPGGTSYIGAGIAAAQGELTGGRHNPSATQIMVIVSDGGDRGAPNPSATLAAANAAKAAGIRIISLQYGASGGTLMQSIASSSADYYQVTP